MLNQLPVRFAEDLTWQNHSYILDIEGNKRTDTNYDFLGVGEAVHFTSEIIPIIEVKLAELGHMELLLLDCVDDHEKMGGDTRVINRVIHFSIG